LPGIPCLLIFVEIIPAFDFYSPHPGPLLKDRELIISKSNTNPFSFRRRGRG